MARRLYVTQIKMSEIPKRLTKQELREDCLEMAKDPDIIRESIAIDREFEETLLDGLEDEDIAQLDL